MLSSVQAGQNTHDDYVKQLLDQRTARTDFRFSTPSDFSDTPSVYSRSFFSPRPHNGGPVSPVNGYTSHDHITPVNLASLDPDNINDSSLGPNRAAVHENHEAEEDLDVESMSHISMLGPKMRFHSRAPWETGEDTLCEGDETVSQLECPAKSRFFNFVPSSPRIGNLVGRPSVESTRSEVARKMSMESTASKGRSSCHTIHTQNKCNLSDTSLGRSCNGGGPDVMQQSSYSRQSQSSTSTPSPPHGTSPNQRFSIDEQTVEFETKSRDNGSMFGESSMPSSPHPYANPDLVAYTTESDELSLSSQAPVDLVGSDSITLTESSLASSVSKCDTVSNLTQTISAASFAPRKSSLSTRHGVQISTPLAAMGHTLQGDKGQRCNALPPSLPGVQKLPGWMEKANTPGFSLISLEEARAQRAKSTTQQASAEALPSASLNGNPSYPDPENAVQNDQSSQYSTVIQRTRARSISASTRAKNALHSAVSQASSPLAPGKPLKHKKSGFMRLLVGSRTSEREERGQPPPVPVLPDTYEPQSYPQRSHSKLHRVPVPELSAHDVANAEDISVRLAKSAFSRKHTPPPLSISSTSIKNTAQAVGTAIETSPRAQSVMMDSSESSWTDKSPHSAPAHVLGFPALKLRPVSTLFSAQFSEHLPELDSDTPRTSSPTTPLSFGPSIHDLTRAVPAPTSLEDRSDEIRALQEHISSSKLTWQRQIWELEGQVRDLKLEVEDLKAAAKEDYCGACGRGKPCNGNSAPDLSADTQQSKTSVVNRPRVRTGISSSRFGNSTA